MQWYYYNISIIIILFNSRYIYLNEESKIVKVFKKMSNKKKKRKITRFPCGILGAGHVHIWKWSNPLSISRVIRWKLSIWLESSFKNLFHHTVCLQWIEFKKRARSWVKILVRDKGWQSKKFRHNHYNTDLSD